MFITNFNYNRPDNIISIYTNEDEHISIRNSSEIKKIMEEFYEAFQINIPNDEMKSVSSDYVRLLIHIPYEHVEDIRCRRGKTCYEYDFELDSDRVVNTMSISLKPQPDGFHDSLIHCHDIRNIFSKLLGCIT